MHKFKVESIENLATAIEITWRYDNSTKMPSTDITEQQIAFEEALNYLSGGNGFAEMVQVSTGLGIIEWLCYLNPA